MKLLRNISIKWKITVPILLLAFLMFAACLQANIATKQMMNAFLELQMLPEASGNGEAVNMIVSEQNLLYQGIRSSEVEVEMKENRKVAVTLREETKRFVQL